MPAEHRTAAKARRRRWAVLLGALVLTLLAAWWPLPEGGAEPASPALALPRLREAARPARPAPAAAQQAWALAANASAPEPGEVDLFAARTWLQAEPAMPAAAPSAAPATAAEPAAAPPPPPSGPPPLPYRYLGRLSEEGAELVYLARGEQTLLARVGDTLDGQYRVLALERLAIEFEHVPSGTRQRLALPSPE